MLNLTDLIKSESVTIRGKAYQFYEIGAHDWLNYCHADEPSKTSSTKELAMLNNEYSAKVAACALKQGVDQPLDEIVKELQSLPGSLLDEFYNAAAKVNGLPTLDDLVKEDSEKKTSPVKDSPES